jgi:hypothetical protein
VDIARVRFREANLRNRESGLRRSPPAGRFRLESREEGARGAGGFGSTGKH